MEQVGNAADRIPVVYAFQVVEVVSGFLAIAAGLGLYLMLRQRARAGSLWRASALRRLLRLRGWQGVRRERG